MDGDIGCSTVQSWTGAGWLEVLAKFITSAQRGATKRVERMNDVSLLCVQVGQFVPTLLRNAVNERKENLMRAEGVFH